MLLSLSYMLDDAPLCGAFDLILPQLVQKHHSILISITGDCHFAQNDLK